MIALILLGSIVGLIAAAEGIRRWKAPGLPSGDPYYQHGERNDPYIASYYLGGLGGGGLGGSGGGADCGGGGGGGSC